MAPLTRTRRTAAVAALAACLARVASIFLWPPDSDASHARMLATASAHPGAWAAATAAEVAAWLLAGFAVLSAIGLVRGRGSWPTAVGGWVYGVSLVALGFVGGCMNSVTGVLATEPDRALMTRVQGDLHSPVLTAFVMLVLVGELALVVFGFGLARSGLVGWWFPALSVLAVVGYVVTASSSAHLVVLAGFVPLGASWLTLAVLLGGSPRVVPAAALAA